MITVDDLTKEFARRGIVVTKTVNNPLNVGLRPTAVALQVFEQMALAEILRLQIETLAITLAGGIGHWSTLSTKQKTAYRATARRAAKGRNGDEA